MLLVLIAVLGATVGELVLYAFLIPDPSRPPAAPSPLERPLGTLAYRVAYVLSVLRAPLGLVPYLVKLIIVFGLGVRANATRTTYRREALNLAGDIANLTATFLVLRRFARRGGPRWRRRLLAAPLAAEVVRLAAERVPIVFSVCWQLIPHRAIARSLKRRRSVACRALAWLLQCYARYYALDDAARAAYLLRALKRGAARDGDLADRLSYITAFRIVPRRHGLRGGHVRDVATGDVFIHDIWTGDPWLLAGMAIRRAPWMFDPRYLPRPLFYWSDANRAATLAVLHHARHCLPFALFQFGHEIRVARMHLFFCALRRIGLDVEEPVRADGTFVPDQLIRRLARHGRGAVRVPR